MKTGVIGLGDMGSGLAKNLLAAGFDVKGLDLNPARQSAFADMGGRAVTSPAEVGQGTDAVFVMVMNGDQAKSVILGDGLVSTMAPGSAVILSATIKPREAREIGAALDGTGLHLIDTPVSGGFPGAQGGTLTMMAAAPSEVRPVWGPRCCRGAGCQAPPADTAIIMSPAPAPSWYRLPAISPCSCAMPPSPTHACPT